jgi:hypothetical protein
MYSSPYKRVMLGFKSSTRNPATSTRNQGIPGSWCPYKPRLILKLSLFSRLVFCATAKRHLRSGPLSKIEGYRYPYNDVVRRRCFRLRSRKISAAYPTPLSKFVKTHRMQSNLTRARQSKLIE